MHLAARMVPPTRVLVVDDEPAIRTTLRSGLEAGGYAVSEAAGKTSLLRCLDTQPVDLITLDLNLAGEDGLQLARLIREKRNVPIIMITGKGGPVDRVAGLEQGADDYIVKPFHIHEVLLRIGTVLRRYQLEAIAEGGQIAADPPEESYRFEANVLDCRRRELKSVNGELIYLTDAEFDLLAIFVRRAARILSRDELAELLKGRNWSPEDRTIDWHVARLRRKIDSDGEMPRLIRSVRGVGYVFTADVQRLDHTIKQSAASRSSPAWAKR